MSDLVVGIDVGTSGVRAMAVDGEGRVTGQATRKLAPPASEGARVTQEPEHWWEAVTAVLGEVARASAPGRIMALAVDGTSGTMLLTDGSGRPTGRMRMYNDGSGASFARRIDDIAPPESGAHGATSPAAWLLANGDAAVGAAKALHQADWIIGRLTGRFGISDDNNALKTGWDPVNREWPGWLEAAGVPRRILPEVKEPGTAVGELRPELAGELGLAVGCRVVAGTTDGCASFLATGAAELGDGMTALGTTLTLKLLADAPVFDPSCGVYSHRLLGMWLAGGASNTGGAALQRFFPAARLAELEPALRPDEPTGLDYYPLPATGERFPENEPAMASRHTPRPDDDARFLQGLLEGIAAVEARAYSRLHELGAPRLRTVRTVGGGAANRAWTTIRARTLGVELLEPTSGEAAYGTARLARHAL